MPKRTKVYRPIWTNALSNVVLADEAKAASLHDVSQKEEKFWDRRILTNAGDDHILRDRPGDYKPDAHIHGHPTGGNVGIWGGEGTDTIDYSLFQGAMEIDLRPLGQDYANTADWFAFTSLDVANAGKATALGIHGLDIHGPDYLHSIENVVGTSYDDKITGDDGENHLKGGGGNDTINGEGGHDTIEGGSGADNIKAGSGMDVVQAGTGHDKVWGGEDNDVINAGSGNDLVYGGSGIDIIHGHLGNDTIHGGDDGDIIQGGDGNDSIKGDEGNDQIWVSLPTELVHRYV